MTKPVIGILAGMGPRTSAPFLEAVLDECARQYGAKWDEDFPDIVLYSLPTPLHPKKRPDDAAMIAALQRGVTAVARAGASFLAVPCNTAHRYYAEIVRAAAGIPVLHIVNETLAQLSFAEAKPIAVLATRATTASELYHGPIRERGGRLVSVKGLQGAVDKLIELFKREGVSERTVADWRDLRGKLLQAGMRQLVIGCTDLSFCGARMDDAAVAVRDSAAILAESAVRAYCERLKAPPTGGVRI